MPGLQIERRSTEKGDMPPILKRSRKPKEEAPDLATLLQPYGVREDEDPGEAVEADAPQTSPPDDDS
jgi:hypothetical protein